jgi:sulfite reductase (ferredoxin)
MVPTGHGKPSKVEGIKVASDHLGGFVSIEALNGLAHFTEEASTVLKFHGSYQQDDRDLRVQMKREGKEKAYQMMVRTRVPGGKLLRSQYLVHDGLARRLGNGTLRITTRQEFQLHGVLKQDLKETIRAINEALLSSLAACGDVERNVLCCPAPIQDPVRQAMQADCSAFASHFAPRSSAYWDIWLDGEKIDNPMLPKAGPVLVPTEGDNAIEPIYGPAYLPRKFKTAFALPEDNCTDIHANDLGYLAIVEDGELEGYNVLVGGGLGTTPSAGKTFPALAEPLTFVARGDVLKIGEAIVKVFRDLGNRSDRKRARLKYIISDMGLPAFKATVERYLGYALPEPRPVRVGEVHDHLGWQPQGDGNDALGIPVENGRIKDEGSLRLASGLRAIFQTYAINARLTCQQSILLTDIRPEWRRPVEGLLAEYGIATVEEVSTVRRWSMACPALPTCGLAVTEAERALPGILDDLEVELATLGLESERFTVRMTGCPNGCARPYNADVGLVGRSAEKNPDGTNSPGTYTIFLGGSTLGDRLNVLFKDYVPYDQVVAELVPVFGRFKAERFPGEPFGDFCHRLGAEALAREPELDPA